MEELKFTQGDGGWILSEDAAKGLAEPAAGSEYCCSIYNDRGERITKVTIDAGSRGEAVSKCMDEARAMGYPAGGVRSGAC